VTSQALKIEDGETLAIPAEFRRKLGIAVGDTVIVEIVDGERHIRSLASAVDNARRIMRQLVPDGVSLADELIADRRAERRDE